MEHSKAVGESGVRCAWKNHLGEAQLTDAAEALKRPRCDDLPEDMLELVSTKLDQVVKRVAHSLCFRYCDAQHLQRAPSRFAGLPQKTFTHRLRGIFPNEQVRVGWA